ncbi:outer membrane protein [Mangrovicella endophytica]|uniref:outer membrane protein n=1 Tax=Mangrovicella endophytica TaxID=2066697 RepID=UPI000C9E9304|nr:outer membrane protein [Mangrovicella endophytica]
MNRLLILAVLGTTVLTPAAGWAADIIEEPIDIVEPLPEKPDYSGWYIRGDVGYVFKSKTSGDYNFWNPGPLGGNPTYTQGIDNREFYDSFELKNTASFGVGAGYRFNDFVRADLTVDYFRTDVKGSSQCGYLVETGYLLDPVDNDCRYDDSSKATVWTTMANAYVDIGHYGIITPYVGAGAGFAYVKYDDLHNVISCNGEPCGNQTDIYIGEHGGETSWRFASSLMAGATFDLTDQLKLDAGYKYTRINEGDAFGYDGPDRETGASGVQTRDHGFDIHAIRAGLRYEFF